MLYLKTQAMIAYTLRSQSSFVMLIFLQHLSVNFPVAWITFDYKSLLKLTIITQRNLFTKTKQTFDITYCFIILYVDCLSKKCQSESYKAKQLLKVMFSSLPAHCISCL